MSNWLKILLTLLLSAFVSAAIFMLPPAATRIDAGQSAFVSARDFCITVLWTATFFAVIARLRLWIRTAALFFLFLIPVIFSYAGIVFNVPYSFGLITTLTEIHAEVAIGFINVATITALMLFIATMAGTAWLIGKIATIIPRKKIFYAGTILVMLATMFFPRLLDSAVYPIHRNYKFAAHAYLCIHLNKQIFKNIGELEAEPSHAEPTEPLPQESIVVFHIGEGARQDHSPLGKYSRNTMPNLKKEIERGSILSAQRCISFASVTRLSVLGMLTPATSADPIIRSQSFFPALRDCGIDTHGFISWHSSKMAHYATTLTAMTASLNACEHTPEFAHAMLPEIKKFVEESPSKNKFLLYQGEGSHLPYCNYDEKKFSKFVPVSFSLARNDSTINAYDNCLYATDDFIEKFIDELRDKPAIYIYAADHGEFMGEHGFWGRRGLYISDKETRDVLFFIWVSDKFKTSFPQKYAVLKDNLHRIKTIGHDHLYHTFLGFYGIKTPNYNAEMDLFSPKAKEFTGVLPELLPADTVFDTIKFENKTLKLDW